MSKENQNVYETIRKFEHSGYLMILRNYYWPLGTRSQLIGPDARKDWGQEEKEDEVIEWHQWLNGYESEQTLGNSEGQGSLMCRSPWGHEESDTTEWLNNSNKEIIINYLGVITVLWLCFSKNSLSWCYWKVLIGDPAARHSKANKRARLVEKKVCFISGAGNAGAGGGHLSKGWLPTHPHCQQARGDKVYRQSRGWATSRNITIISNSHLQIGHHWSD